MRRKSQSGATDGGTATRRGWGPFSGGQLTAIIITLAVLLLFPVGAWALSFTNVSIIDPGGVNRAKVTSTGQLQTHPNGPLTVNGAITATQTSPNSSYLKVTTFGISSDDVCAHVTNPVPAGKALVITSVTVDVTQGDGPISFSIFTGTTSGGPCSGKTLEFGTVPSPQSAVLPMPSGVPVKAGNTIDLNISNPGPTSANALVAVHGYLVASTQCTVTGPPVGCI